LVTAIIRDISERKALERLQQEFLAMVSHELKNPLTAMKTFGQLLRDTETYHRRAVEVILHQIDRLDRLIGDLLDVSRLEARRLRLSRERVDLVALVQRVVQEARAMTTRHQIEVAAPTAPVVGWWDRHRLEQVLQNLLSNAIKYAPQGGRIGVTVVAAPAAAQVSVRDPGVGIPPEALPRLFSRFFRVEQAEASSVQGLGLGLYISKALIEAHGGRIWVESTPGAGSTFFFRLPYAMAEEE